MIRTPLVAGFTLALFGASSWAAEASFVVGGKAVDVRAEGGRWASQDGALVGAGEGNVLYAGKRFGRGDFTASARLTIDRLRASAASVVINGSHFGFEGKSGEMFTEGAIFGRRDLGAPVVKAGEAFGIVVGRAGDTLSIAIDGKQVVAGKLAGGETVDLGLRPHRSTMRVVDFIAAGELVAAPEPLPHTDVFVSGTGDYHTYRIPAIVVTKKGTLLAFCEGRKSGRGDAGNIDMLVKRSADGGKTWTGPVVIWDDAGNTCGNPAPVVDQDTGTIWLPMTWNLGSDHERDIMAGKSKHPRRVYVTHSADDGLTWAEPTNISETTREEHWRWYATGPGNAIQLTRDPHKGRLLIPANHSDHSDPSKHPYRSHVIWSDDGGASWQLGGVHDEKTNESAVVELSGGAVLQVMRSYHDTGRRAMSVSDDGGATWGADYLDDALQTPVCQANILRWNWPDGGSPGTILFCSPKGGGRSHLTVWLSEDDGKTWPVSREIYAGGAAYSNLVALPDGKVGVLYEKDGYKTISLVSFPLEWVKGDSR